MKIRAVRPALDRSGAPVVRDVPVLGAAAMVTLDDPGAPPETAQNAFARLRPPPDHPEAETRSWRILVAAHALAVRVLPAPRANPVPDALGCGEPGVGVKEEALAVARATGDGELVALVERILVESEGGLR